MIISKGIRGYEEPKIYFSRRCNKRTYLCGSVNYPESCKAVQIRERNIGEILGYLSPWCSVCTHPLLISKEARVMESPKMYSSRRCNRRTYLSRTANYPDSCKAVQCRERNIGEIWGYLLPWFSVCTKARIISNRG